jgi:hypothetical protein
VLIFSTSDTEKNNRVLVPEQHLLMKKCTVHPKTLHCETIPLMCTVIRFLSCYYLQYSTTNIKRNSTILWMYPKSTVFLNGHFHGNSFYDYCFKVNIVPIVAQPRSAIRF